MADANKMEVVQKLAELREQYEELVAQNESATDLEKLTNDDLIADPAEQSRVLREIEKDVETVHEDIKFQNLGYQLIRRRIKDLCWETSLAKGAVMKGFKEDRTVGEVTRSV